MSYCEHLTTTRERIAQQIFLLLLYIIEFTLSLKSLVCILNSLISDWLFSAEVFFFFSLDTFPSLGVPILPVTLHLHFASKSVWPSCLSKPFLLSPQIGGQWKSSISKGNDAVVWRPEIYLSHGERGATVRFQCSCSCCFGQIQREVLSEHRAKGSPWSICCGKGRFCNATDRLR